ncbi:MAG TPA: S-layer homology domain-containing protein [Bacillus sp. (in: firmicutes)]|nr:S-layer homology domain-containing protein [Bacillus sp. (in: firmicutes)]
MKRLTVFFAAALLFSTIAPAAIKAENAAYQDVSASYWAKKEIDYLSESGIIKGYSNGKFGINDPVKRSQAAIMLVRALNLSTANRPNPQFSDVPFSHPAYLEIAAAVDAGLFSKGGKFNPNASLTRAQMAKILVNAFSLNKTTQAIFPDVATNNWAYPYITKLLGHKITTGYSDGTFKPNQTLTRTQFAVFLARTLNPAFQPRFIVYPRKILDTIFYPQVAGLPAGVSTNINNALYGHAEQAKRGVEEVRKLAEADKNEGLPVDSYTYGTGYDVKRADNEYISIIFTDYTYTGGAHGMYWNTGYTFDTKTGSLLTLGEVANNSNYVNIINDEIHKQIQQRRSSGEYTDWEFKDFSSINNDTGFYVTAGGIVIYFQPYEYTPYALGIPEFSIPFSAFQE